MVGAFDGGLLDEVGVEGVEVGWGEGLDGAQGEDEVEEAYCEGGGVCAVDGDVVRYSTVSEEFANVSVVSHHSKAEKIERR